MKYARIVDNIVVETIDWNPEGRYPEDWIWVECPENVRQRWTYENDTFTPPDGEVVPDPDPEPEEPGPETLNLFKISPLEFKMMFTSEERLAIRALRRYEGDDAQSLQIKNILDDWFEIVDDPRLTHVDLKLAQTQQGIGFLVTIGVLTEERSAEILAGLPPETE